MSYRYLEGWTSADVALEAKGSALEELFRSALDATMNVMVLDLNSVEQKETRHDRLEAATESDLLHEFLQRALYYKDADQLLLRADQLSITRSGEKWSLDFILRGEKIDPAKHELAADVKAITHHRFEVKRENGGWVATVVLDV